jgi:ankyrin repeat protein
MVKTKRFAEHQLRRTAADTLVVMLQFVNPNELSRDDKWSITLLHHLANLLDPFDYSTPVNQLILAKQLVGHGASVNALSIPHGVTPLHTACYSGNVTNLDFVEYLLEQGADPNAQNYLGATPLMYTMPDAPGAAKFLLNWSTTDIDITTRSGDSFLAGVRFTITDLSDKVARPDNLEKIQHQFQLQQWREIEGMLVERGAVDTDTTSLG